MLLGRESEVIKNLGDLVLRHLDPPANRHFLLPRKQRHRSHLLQIHPHRVVQPLGTAAVLLVIYRQAQYLRVLWRRRMVDFVRMLLLVLLDQPRKRYAFRQGHGTVQAISGGKVEHGRFLMVGAHNRYGQLF